MRKEDRYTYSIFPRRPIRNLVPGKSIRKACTLQLTYDEVLKCISYGPVYRILVGHAPIRVTGSNLASLHISTLEYNALLDAKSTAKLSEMQKSSKIASEVDEKEVSYSGTGHDEKTPQTIEASQESIRSDASTEVDHADFTEDHKTQKISEEFVPPYEHFEVEEKDTDFSEDQIQKEIEEDNAKIDTKPFIVEESLEEDEGIIEDIPVEEKELKEDETPVDFSEEFEDEEEEDNTENKSEEDIDEEEGNTLTPIEIRHNNYNHKKKKRH